VVGVVVVVVVVAVAVAVAVVVVVVVVLVVLVVVVVVAVVVVVVVVVVAVVIVMVCFCSLGYDVTACRPLASTAQRCACGLFYQETPAVFFCARTRAHAMSSCSGFPQNTPFGSLRVEQKVHPCGAQHVSIQVLKCGEKKQVWGHLLELRGSKNCTALWLKHLEMLKT